MEYLIRVAINVVAFAIVYVPVTLYAERKYSKGRAVLSLELQHYTEETKKLRQALQEAAAKDEEKTWNIELLRGEVSDLASDDVIKKALEKLKKTGVEIL